jgi:hypothetical protein
MLYRSATSTAPSGCARSFGTTCAHLPDSLFSLTPKILNRLRTSITAPRPPLTDAQGVV